MKKRTKHTLNSNRFRRAMRYAQNRSASASKNDFLLLKSMKASFVKRQRRLQLNLNLCGFRPVTSLGHPVGKSVFWDGPNF